MAAKKRKGLDSMSTPPHRREYADTPDELVAEIEARQAKKAAEEKAAEDKLALSKAKTVKVTLTLPADLLAELRAMAVELPPKAFPSISGFAANAIREALEKARIEHNGGKPFESDERPEVRTGRPPGN